MSTTNFNTAPLSVLVAEFNKITGQNVKRFPDRKTAIRRLKAVALPPAKKQPSAGAGKMTKREQLVSFIRATPRTLDEICETFEIKRNTASTHLADIANPKYCGKALGSPVKVLRTEDGRVYAE